MLNETQYLKDSFSTPYVMSIVLYIRLAVVLRMENDSFRLRTPSC